MPFLTTSIDRRHVLKAGAASLAAASIPAALRAQTAGDAVLFTIADLHSPYARLPAILSRLRQARADTDMPMALLINGDVFERGNVVALRSGAEADWAFLRAAAAEMPVILNLGNHETAIMDDMAEVVARAREMGVQVVSNLVDTRTGEYFAEPGHRLMLGDVDIALLGLATTNAFVYREEVRDTLGFADPAEFAREALPVLVQEADLVVVMSHAGVTPDKAVLNALPPGAVIQGGHDHLSFEMTPQDALYFHGASWGTLLGRIDLTLANGAVRASYSAETIPAGSGDGDLAALIAAQMETHLTAEDREVLARIPQTLDLHASILVAAEAVRQAAQADLAMLSHTTFGAPLSEGPFTRYDLDAFIRFGGGISVTEISGADLTAILSRTNQFAAASLDARTGDYMHVAEVDLDPDATYRLAMNSWPASNQESYLGTDGLTFQDVEGLELKEIVTRHLASG
ncbi:5'-nucleotidase C-terminal domain-containing protein [Pseudoroseicyclus aestuarii]|uniref:2',3'-cyclic-nucleotide 2'-phosphodiesterase (5'-nucleotidase family) n=1 Tax=Pseudoroseicyclus aestuarii TaxID=1795041 RepID=A0A318SMK0_9RHOB|nr:5'-nucleotidase C-terminal domain-containing protein [Pseudoroseicyclus aestuarii]PYE81163.1 2',3'-cyclic-nucleotide 2'-phosphodiesterase (5'-nucleotidase family) [Pseudoroseicyclus aestuarii]